MHTFFRYFREIQFFASHEPVNTAFSTKLGFDAQNLENDRKHKHMQTFFNQFSYFELARAREYRIFTKNLVFMRNILKTIQKHKHMHTFFDKFSYFFLILTSWSYCISSILAIVFCLDWRIWSSSAFTSLDISISLAVITSHFDSKFRVMSLAVPSLSFYITKSLLLSIIFTWSYSGS